LRDPRLWSKEKKQLLYKSFIFKKQTNWPSQSFAKKNLVLKTIKPNVNVKNSVQDEA
jgi:hypothetical protein